MTCTICGKVICDHSPAERGQTLSQMLDSMSEDVIPSAQKAIEESSEILKQNRALADIVLKINRRRVVVKGSPTYINDEVYKTPPEDSRALAIIHNFGVNYAKAFQETKNGKELLNPSELEALLKKDINDKDRYSFWLSDERSNLVGGTIFRGFAYWTSYGAGIAPKESLYEDKLILAKVGRFVKSKRGLKVLPDDKTAVILPEDLLQEDHWIDKWKFNSGRGMMIPKFKTEGELGIHNKTFVNLTRYKSRPEFMPLTFGFDESVNCVKSYYSQDFGGWSGHHVQLEIPSPNESPRLECANPKELFGVWKRCQRK